MTSLASRESYYEFHATDHHIHSACANPVLTGVPGGRGFSVLQFRVGFGNC